MSNAIAALGPDDFASASQRLLPPGAALPRDPAANLTSLLTGLAGRQAAVHADAALLSEVESDPRQTVVLLPGWEDSFGLPDPCSPPAPTLQQRQNALAARIAARGGQSPAYYIDVALSLGYAITITEFQAATYGHTTYGSPWYDYIWEDTWQVNVSGITEIFAAFGHAFFGDPYATYSNSQLGCVLNRIKPGHTKLLINAG